MESKTHTETGVSTTGQGLVERRSELCTLHTDHCTRDYGHEASLCGSKAHMGGERGDDRLVVAETNNDAPLAQMG